VPTYDYECGACKKSMEIFHSIRETKVKCPLCGKPKLTKLIGPGSGFLFRGSGFYITDYRSSDYMAKAKADSGCSKSTETSTSTAEKSGGEKASKAKERTKATA
jgi:putative FmdB family regulatory protein